MSHSHLTRAEHIGIEVFGATGRVPGALPDALARHHSTISSKLRQSSSKPGFVPGLLTAAP